MDLTVTHDLLKKTKIGKNMAHDGPYPHDSTDIQQVTDIDMVTQPILIYIYIYIVDYNVWREATLVF